MSVYEVYRHYKRNSDVSALLIKLPSELNCGWVSDLLVATSTLWTPIYCLAVQTMNLAHGYPPVFNHANRRQSNLSPHPGIVPALSTMLTSAQYL